MYGQDVQGLPVKAAIRITAVKYKSPSEVEAKDDRGRARVERGKIQLVN